MPNPRLAARYAKSLIDLSTEKGQLDVVYNDMKFLQVACKQSKQLVSVLRSPVINSDKKDAILSALTKAKVSEITFGFNKLLVRKNREENLPEIAEAFIEQYNAIKGIHKVKLTTAQPLSNETTQALTSKIKGETDLQNIELETAVNEALIGGFVLQFDNKLIDASIARDLRDIKKQFSKNIYIQNIR
jgi:F-type H+-transporting ATPase subunit delta